MLEETVAYEVLILRDVVYRFRVDATQVSLCTFDPGIDALSCLTVEELADGIEVVQICTKPLQGTKDICDDTFQIASTAFQRMLRIRLKTIKNIHIWSILANGHDGQQALSIWIALIVGTYQGVTLRDGRIRSEPFNSRCKVVKRYPVQPVLTLLLTNAYTCDTQLVRLGDIPVVLSRRLTVVLLYHNDITHAERV